MCSSSLNYAPGGSNPISPRFRALFTDEEKAAIEDALDQALPLVNDFYNANVNYQFEVIEGTFVSPYTEEEYTQKFIINGSIEILANIEFEFDDEEKIEYSLYYNLFEKTDNDDDDDDDDDIPSVTEASSSDDSSSSQDNSDETSDTSDTTDTSDDESSEDVVFAKALLDDEDDVEIETLYKMEGIAVVGENEYPFRAKAEHEVETDETETELIFALWKDDANYIVIRQEIEIEGTEGQPDYEYEEKFHYYVVTDGQVTRDFFLEFENEDSELELEIIIDGLKYEVEYVEEDGKLYIDIKIDGDETYRFEKVVTVDEETNEVTVTYNYIA